MGRAFQREVGRGPGVERTECAPASEVTRDWNYTPNVLGGSKAPCHLCAFMYAVLPLSTHPNLPICKSS